MKIKTTSKNPTRTSLRYFSHNTHRPKKALNKQIICGFFARVLHEKFSQIRTKRVFRCCLNSFYLKIIAIIAMTIDHIGYMFFPHEIWLRVIGRLTFPIMGFMIAQGYHHTKDKKKYAARLLGGGILSMIPFHLAFGYPLNVMFTLCAGLLALMLTENEESLTKRLMIVSLLSTLTLFFDWGISGVWLIYIMGRHRGRAGIVLGVIIGGALSIIPETLLNIFYYKIGPDLSGSAFRLGILAAVPLLFMYNGKRGPGAKYLFYVYYPAHLLVLALVKLFLTA